MTRHFDERPQTVGEEMANSLSHGLGFLLAIASLPILVTFAAQRSSASSVVGACAFSVTAMLLYFASAMYHALPAGCAKRIFNVLDHSAIYLFIAGSYTPFTLGVDPLIRIRSRSRDERQSTLDRTKRSYRTAIGARQ